MTARGKKSSRKRREEHGTQTKILLRIEEEEEEEGPFYTEGLTMVKTHVGPWPCRHAHALFHSYSSHTIADLVQCSSMLKLNSILFGNQQTSKGNSLRTVVFTA